MKKIDEIKNEEDYQEALKIIDFLMNVPDYDEELDRLATLVEEYENDR